MNTALNPSPACNPDFEFPRKVAYDRTERARLALSREDLIQVNLDITLVVHKALVAHKNAGALRDQLATLPDAAREEIAQLQDYALALSYSHGRLLTKPTATSELIALNAEATKIRRSLHADLCLLANHGRVDPQQFGTYSGRTGYKIVASDLLLTVTLIRKEWHAIQGLCACTSEELSRGEALAVRILELVAQRKESEGVPSPEAEQRTRAFTLLLRCYASLRRAVNYLRWQERDVDWIVPSLYKIRKPRRKSKAAKKTRREVPAVSCTPPSMFDKPFLK